MALLFKRHWSNWVHLKKIWPKCTALIVSCCSLFGSIRFLCSFLCQQSSQKCHCWYHWIVGGKSYAWWELLQGEVEQAGVGSACWGAAQGGYEELAEHTPSSFFVVRSLLTPLACVPEVSDSGLCLHPVCNGHCSLSEEWLSAHQVRGGCCTEKCRGVFLCRNSSVSCSIIL